MSAITLYRVPQVVNLTASSGAPLMNYPVNRTDFTIYAYVDNIIDVMVRNVDRQAVSFANSTATIFIQDPKNQRLIMARDLQIANAVQGHLQLFVTGDEAAAFPRQDLKYSVVMVDPSNVSTLLMTDRNRAGFGVVHVEDGPLPFPKEPIVVTWADFYQNNGAYVAGSFPGASISQNETGLQSIAMQMNGFTGTVNIQGSLELIPSQNPESWFLVSTTSYTNQTGLVAVTFEGNLMWVRFQVFASNGTIDTLTYRN